MSSFFALIIFYECSPRAKIVALLSFSRSVASRSRIPVLISIFAFFFTFCSACFDFFRFFCFGFFREPAVLFSWSVPIFGLIIVLLIVVGLAQVFCSTSLCKTQPLLGNASRARHAL